MCLLYKYLTLKELNMKQLMLSTALCALFSFPMQSVFAADKAEALAKANNCLLCHSVDHKGMGPAYKDVAKKYRGDKTAESKLIAKVKAGGGGVWGDMPMPPNSPQVKDEDIKTIVAWILTL
jgi:cytochrome c